jgi:putative aldouronate transport system permease protein
MPTIIILLILQVGRMMEVGFEKVLLLYNPATYETADVIATFVYKRGIMNAEYSFAAAIGLFNNLINLTLLFTVNYFSRKLSRTSLW